MRFAQTLGGRLPDETLRLAMEFAEYGEPELAIDTLRAAAEQAGLRLSDAEQAELDDFAQAEAVQPAFLDSLAENRRRWATERAATSHPSIRLRERTLDYLRLGYRVEGVGPAWVTLSRERYWARLAGPLLWLVRLALRIAGRQPRDWVRLEVQADGVLHESNSAPEAGGGPS